MISMSRHSPAQNTLGNLHHALRSPHHIVSRHDYRVVSDQNAIALGTSVKADAAATSIFHIASRREVLGHPEGVRHYQIFHLYDSPANEARNYKNTIQESRASFFASRVLPHNTLSCAVAKPSRTQIPLFKLVPYAGTNPRTFAGLA